MGTSDSRLLCNWFRALRRESAWSQKLEVGSEKLIFEVLPIIKHERRTIEIVKINPESAAQNIENMAGLYPQKPPTPPTPPPGFYENKALSPLSVLHAKKTKELQTPKCRKTAVLHRIW